MWRAKYLTWGIRAHDPDVWSGRAVQEVSSILAMDLASMYLASDWTVIASVRLPDEKYSV